MNEPQRTRQIVLGLLSLCALLYFWDLGRIPFYNYEESKEALIVWEMVNGGGWILPLRNGVEQPLKPPLFHWIGASFSLIAGQVSEFAVRFPSALFATATVLATFFFGRAIWNWRIGLLAALILATSPEWVRWSINARSDMVLLFFLTATQFFFFTAFQERATQQRTLFLFYASIGFAVLAKGPLGLLLPILMTGTFLWWTNELTFLRHMRIGQGIVIAGCIAASWYLLALVQGGGEFFQRQILDENVFRFFSSEKGGPSRDHTLLYYFPTLFIGMLPWSLFFPALGIALYRTRDAWRDKKRLYLLIWVGAEFLFFTLASGKRSNYILPLYPALALLLGVWWQEVMEGARALSPLIKRVARGCALLLCSVGALILVVLIAHGVGFDLDHMVSPYLHPRDRANLPIIAQSLQSQFSIVFIWIALLAVATGWFIWGFIRDQWVSVFAALTVSISASMYFTNALFHPLLAQERTYKPFMLGVRSTVQDAPLYFYQDASDYGAIFYADRRIPDYPKIDSSGDKTVNADTALYLLVREKDWPELSGSHPRAERLVMSEGEGPDKKHRLVLAAILPQQQNGASGLPATSPASESPSPQVEEKEEKGADTSSASVELGESASEEEGEAREDAAEPASESVDENAAEDAAGDAA